MSTVIDILLVHWILFSIIYSIIAKFGFIPRKWLIVDDIDKQCIIYDGTIIMTKYKYNIYTLFIFNVPIKYNISIIIIICLLYVYLLSTP
jgi:hypothetical protein